MFNIGTELLMRRIVTAPPAIWAVVSQCARLSPAADDQESRIDFAEIAARIGAPLVEVEPTTKADVDLSWVTKPAKPQKAVTDFPDPKGQKQNHV